MSDLERKSGGEEVSSLESDEEECLVWRLVWKKCMVKRSNYVKVSCSESGGEKMYWLA